MGPIFGACGRPASPCTGPLFSPFSPGGSLLMCSSSDYKGMGPIAPVWRYGAYLGSQNRSNTVVATIHHTASLCAPATSCAHAAWPGRGDPAFLAVWDRAYVGS